MSFYLANTNYTYKRVWPVGDTGADGWLRDRRCGTSKPFAWGLHKRESESWNNVSVTWTPDTGVSSGETGVLTMSSAYLDPSSGPVSSTTHRRRQGLEPRRLPLFFFFFFPLD